MFRYLLPLFILLSFLSCCHSKSYNLLLQAEELMTSRPDSALTLLNDMDGSLLESRKEQALYALLMSEALDRNYIKLTTDSVIRSAKEYYSRKGNKKHRAKMYFYYGRIYLNVGNMDEAVKNFMYASQYLSKKDYHLKGMISSTWGYIHSRQRNYGDALPLFEQATEVYRKNGDKKRLCYTLKCEGNMLFLLRDYERAMERSAEALGIAEELNDTVNIITLCTYMAAGYFYHFDDIPKAKELLLTTYSTYLSGSVPEKDYAFWGAISLSEGDFETAERYFSEAKDIEKSPRRHMAFMDLKSGMHESKGEYKESLDYLKEWKVLRDSLDRAESEVLLHSLERKYQTQLLQESYDLLKKKRRYQHLLTVLIVLLSVAVIVVLISQVRKERARKEQELEKMRELAYKMKEDYEQNRDKFDSIDRIMAEDLGSYKEAFRQQISDIKELVNEAGTYGNNEKLFFEKVKAYICMNKNRDSKLLTNLQKIADLNCSGSITYLKKKHPDLNDNDLNLISLILLNFTASAIEMLYSYTNTASLYNRRRRIREKLGLPEEIIMETYLKNLPVNK